MGCRTPVFVAPYPHAAYVAGLRSARREGARIRGRLGAAPVVGVVGELAPEMRLPVVLEAAARLEAHTVVMGRRVAGHNTEAEVRAFAGDRATVVADPTDSRIAAWTAACDLVLDVRGPSPAEVSGLLLRALQLGVPVAVGPVGARLDWPETAVLRLGDGHLSASEISRALRPLLREPRERASLAREGRALAGRMAVEAPSAYREAVVRTRSLIHDPVRWTLARWGEGLREIGVNRARAAEGYGRSYAEALAELAGTEG
jgi:hypothetical protein